MSIIRPEDVRLYSGNENIVFEIEYYQRARQHFVELQTQEKAMPQETFTHRLSLGGFRIDPTCPKDRLDLYGVCTKARQ